MGIGLSRGILNTIVTVIMKDFVHLHTHSHYSLLDGLIKIDDLVAEVARLEMPAIALTDHGNLYGAIEFYQKAQKAGVQPILGVEAYIAQDRMSDRRPGIDEKRYHLIVLAENDEGYRNLVALTTKAHLEGFYYKPRLDHDTLRAHAQGLIALSGCMSGEIPSALLAGDYERAKHLAALYKDIFGAQNFFIEVSSHAGIAHHDRLQDMLTALAQETNTPTVATQDAHYLKPEDANAQDVLLAVQTNTRLDDTDRLTMKDDDFSLRSGATMAGLFRHNPAALAETREIAKRVSYNLPLGHTQLPHFPLPAGETAESYLKKLTFQNAYHRYGEPLPREVADRLAYELDVINKTGFSAYFLIVQDLVNWAKQQGIAVGPGRGSAAGSLVSYVLNITAIDPLHYQLLFERFMNPARISPPDIDLDFADVRKEEVLNYAAQKYGRDHVAQIITFGTMAARAAVRDAGRALGMTYQFCDELAKMIPFGRSLDHALKEVPELAASYKSNNDTKKIIDAALRLEGVARHASTHACGVVITKDPLTTLVPLQMATAHGAADTKEKTSLVTQYEMHAIEDLGLLKIDFLGLANLTIIEETTKRIKARHQKDIDMTTIPLDDPKPFALLAEGRTAGIFQFESMGMTRYLKEMEPNHLEDLIAMVALYRPGPMELIPSYIKRKHGQEHITYLHPKLAPILEKTYGIGIYQEQMMQIARDLAGFSLAEADTLRKAIGKKIKSLLAEQQEKLIAGMRADGIDQHIANQIWELFPPFARYGFNRSHAAAYALVAYQTAWLKAHYPIEFFASLLNAEAKNVDRMSFLIAEAKREGLEVLPPHVNESDATFTVVSNAALRFGLGAIKNVGHNLVEALAIERKQNGPFATLTAFIERIPPQSINKKSLEALIKAGALDTFGERNMMLVNMDTLLAYQRDQARERDSKQSSLFGMMENAQAPALALAHAPVASLNDRLRWEKELLGLYVSGHPLERFQRFTKNLAKKIHQLETIPEGATVAAAGLLLETKRIFTKKGDPMMFIKLADETAEIEGVVFPSTLEQFASLLQPDRCVLVRGRISHRNGSLSIICNTIEPLKE